mmetsp:Transcript_68725/g.201206  ORF Transcript_68725/g.201206 Transcript_68725/m.201206 type:complete len:348 (-) Transcript_68725:713-1756(-)
MARGWKLAASDGHENQLVAVAWSQHGRPPLPVIKLWLVKFSRRQNLSVLPAADHDHVTEPATPSVHPLLPHTSQHGPAAGCAPAEALHAPADAVLIINAPKGIEMAHAAASLPSRSGLAHVRSSLVPATCSQVVCLYRPQPLGPCRATEHPKSAAQNGSRGRGAWNGHGPELLPFLHPAIEDLHRAQQLLAVEASNREGSVTIPSPCTVAPGREEVCACQPLPSQDIQVLAIAQRLVLLTPAAKDLCSRAQGGSAKVRPLSTESSAGPPATVLHVQELHRGEVSSAIMATYGVRERKREEADAIEFCLPAQPFRLLCISRCRRRLGVPQEIEDGAEVGRVAVQVDAA